MNIFYLKFIFFVIIIAYGAVRLPYAKKCRNKACIKSIHCFFEKFKVFIAWLGMCLVPMIYIFTSLLDGFDINIPLYVRLFAFLGLIADIIFFHYIHKALDDNWSAILEIKDGQKLITNGVYKYIRHPMYTQCWICVILQGIFASNILVEIFGIVTWGFMYFTRVSYEEKMMLEQFKEEYKIYMTKTGRLLPKFL